MIFRGTTPLTISWVGPCLTLNDPVQNAIFKYRNHPSILSIKSNNATSTFDFTHVSPESVKMLSNKSLNFVLSYLSNRKQIVKLKSIFSSWLE